MWFRYYYLPGAVSLTACDAGEVCGLQTGGWEGGAYRHLPGCRLSTSSSGPPD